MGRIGVINTGETGQDPIVAASEDADADFARAEADAFLKQPHVRTLAVFRRILESLDYSGRIKQLMQQRAVEAGLQ